MNLPRSARLAMLLLAQSLTAGAWLILLLLVLNSSAEAEGMDNSPAELSLGSVAMDIPAVMHQRLKPLADYLTRELGRPVRLHVSPNLSTVVKDVAAGKVDIAYLTPIAYVNARSAGNVHILAKTVTQGSKALRLMLVTRADSPIRSPRDLVGKNFAFGDEAAILQRAVVVNAGVMLEQLGSYRFLGHYDNIARGVANGDFDAGILKDTSALQWETKGLRTFYTSPELPPYNLVASPHVDAPLRRAIQAALLRLNPQDPEQRAVIKALDASYDGFAQASDADYDVVRQLTLPFRK